MPKAARGGDPGAATVGGSGDGVGSMGGSAGVLPALGGATGSMTGTLKAAAWEAQITYAGTITLAS